MGEPGELAGGAVTVGEAEPSFSAERRRLGLRTSDGSPKGSEESEGERRGKRGMEQQDAGLVDELPAAAQEP